MSNRNRCSGCGRLAGPDGYCKNCRPETARNESGVELVRDNFMDYASNFGAQSFWSDEFSVLRDKFGIER